MFSFLLVVLLFLNGSGDAENTDWDFSVNKTFYLPNSGGEIICSPYDNEVDSYWIDSWTADAEAYCWNTPEKYDFVKGDTISCVTFFGYVAEPYWELIRYDGFYFCGETDWQNYIAYGWMEFPDLFWWGGICLGAIYYDTSIIPDRFLPLRVDWASRCFVPTGWFAGGVPLSGRPDCFTITGSCQ